MDVDDIATAKAVDKMSMIKDVHVEDEADDGFEEESTKMTLYTMVDPNNEDQEMVNLEES